jgi:formylglycine-generating enzyme required for sulfatase activity
MKKPILSALYLSVAIGVFGQVAHEKFVQEIPNTSLSFSMEAIPGGMFLMGSEISAHADEKPSHKVEISPFWMSTYEITWDLFEAFLYRDYEQAKRISTGAVVDDHQTYEALFGYDIWYGEIRTTRGSDDPI